jgi:hypothetical protein
MTRQRRFVKDFEAAGWLGPRGRLKSRSGADSRGPIDRITLQCSKAGSVGASLMTYRTKFANAA